MSDKATRQRNPYAKNTYRVINEPFKLFGILDWRYAAVALIPSVFFGLLAGSKIAGGLVFAFLAWRAWQISEDDPSLPLAWWSTLFDQHHLSGFTLEKTRKER
jgi:hypothetical protein